MNVKTARNRVISYAAMLKHIFEACFIVRMLHNLSLPSQLDSEDLKVYSFHGVRSDIIMVFSLTMYYFPFLIK